MQFKHAPAAVSAAFDDQNLVSTTGLVPMLRLAQAAGLADLAQQRLSVPTDRGANAGAKVSALVAGMLAGADSIDDMNLLRHGGMGRLLDRVWDLGSAEASEMAKLAETTYRDVNVGLANQFGLFAAEHGIDAYQVIEACNSQPYSHIHRPGIAVGGHCIPVYPRLYLSTDPGADIVRTARVLNASMPERLVAQAEGILGSLDGLQAVVLGAAYRGGVKETAFSGVFPTVEALTARGAQVRVHDPLYSDEELRGLGFEPYTLGDEVDLAVLQTDHADYRGVGPAQLPGIRLIVDGRNATDPATWAGTPRIVVGVG